jgi:ketosteroid isomerase-like protein
MSAIETFFAAWSERHAERRAGMISQAVSEDVSYADPRTPAPLSGTAALADYLGQFSESAPGWAATVIDTAETNGMTRATIRFAGPGPDGAEMVQFGQYFIDTAADGRIARMTGFVGTGRAA